MRFVLIISADFPDGSGPPRRFLLLARGLVAAGHTVKVIVPQRFRPGPLTEQMHGLSVEWGVLTDASRWSRIRERLAARWSALRILWRSAKPGLDWLVLSNPGLDGLAYIALAKVRGASVAVTYDDLRARREHPTVFDRLRSIWLHMADQIIPRVSTLNIATSHFLRVIVEGIAPSTPTFILPPLVDMAIFRERLGPSSDVRTRWSLHDHPIVAYLGTYWFVEGLSVLLEAATCLRTAGHNFRLVISGAAHEGLDCDSPAKLAHHFGVQDVVVETGWLSTNDVIDVMSAAAILVIPKLDDVANRAGMPAKLAEYLSMGRAVVASNVGEIPRYITDHHNALLCEPGDVESLAAALDELLRDPCLRDNLASRARDAAREHFDYLPIVRRLSEQMRSLRNT
jgi:glycosyltransferase involved in cell wall biosynthesis